MMQTYGYLIASVLALLPAPALAAIGTAHRSLLAGLNGFVMAFVALLVFLHLLPHAVAEVGLWSLVLAAVGYGLPHLLEAAFKPAQHHRWLGAVLLAGAALHAAADGAALAGAADRGAGTLPMAVLAHRLPVGLAVWWLAGGRRRPVLAGACLAMLGVATGVGFGLGAWLPTWSSTSFAMVEAFVGGALLHVLRGTHFWPHDERPSSPSPVAETAGVAVAFAGALLVPGDAHGASTPQAVLQMALISAPALVLGFLLAGLLGTSVPPAGVRWASRGGPWSQSLRGTALGLPIPICSCGIVPVYAGLHRAGIPASASLAFLIAAPELGIESLLLSYPLLGPELASSRLVAAAVVAVSVGAIVGRLVVSEPVEPPGAAAEPAAAAPQGTKVRLARALEVGFSELLESTGPWILFGLVVAALLDPAMLQGIAGWAGPWTVLLFAIVGIPLYVCASGATPLAAALVAAGVSPGAALAFLLSGPATNVTTFGLLRRLHGLRIAALFGFVAVLVAVGLGLALDAVWSAAWTPPKPADFGDEVGWMHWAALAVLVAATLRLALVRGPTALVQGFFGSASDTPAAPASCASEPGEPSCCPSVVAEH